MKEEKFEFIDDNDVAMEFPRVKNWLNANMFGKDYETPKGESMTVPDQTMSMREIISRYARGLPINASMRQDAYYDEFGEFPDTSNMDLAEVQALRLEYENELRDVNKRIREEKEKKAAADRKKANDVIYERIKKEKELENDKKAADVPGK